MTLLIKGPRGFWPGQSISGQLVGFVIGYAVVLVFVALVRPQQVLVFKLPSVLPLLFLAPLIGIACILLEYLAGVLILFLRTGKIVTSLAVHSSYSAVSRIAIEDVLSILAVVIGEEFVLRQFLYSLLVTDFAMPPWIVILLCTVAYAMNHLSFGIASAISKLPSGLLYLLLFYVSGLSVGVVIVAHATQNLTLLAVARRIRAK